MKNNIKIVALLAMVCLLGAAHYARAASADTYVRVQPGNVFHYQMILAGPAYGPIVGTFQLTVTIDNVTDLGGSASIGMHQVYQNATMAPVNQSFYVTVDETDTVTSDFDAVINFNIVTKTYQVHTDDGLGNIYWENATWDVNGMMETKSRLNVVDGVLDELMVMVGTDTMYDYVGVRVNNMFYYDASMITGGMSLSGTMTVHIDNMTDIQGVTGVGYTMKMTAMGTTQTESGTLPISETDVAVVNYAPIINKNISNKTYSLFVDDGMGNIDWENATWDANGVLLTSSVLMVSGEATVLVQFSRSSKSEEEEGGIGAFPLVEMLSMVTLGVIVVAWRLRKRSIACPTTDA
jgi:hypothetical protein